MAFMNQETKKLKEPTIKAILKKYGLKGSLSVQHYSTLVLTIKAGKLDFIGNYKETFKEKCIDNNLDYLDINVYWYQNHFTGSSLDCLRELITAMNEGNHNRSDIQSDYFDVGFYIDVNVGKWNNPYTFEV